jgi:hypothetical protein
MARSWIERFPETIAGVVAAVGRQWQTAEEHFRTALKHKLTTHPTSSSKQPRCYWVAVGALGNQRPYREPSTKRMATA